MECVELKRSNIHFIRVIGKKITKQKLNIGLVQGKILNQISNKNYQEKMTVFALSQMCLAIVNLREYFYEVFVVWK